MENGPVKKGWIYALTKEGLGQRLQAHGLSTEGSLDDLRRAISAFVSQHPELFTDSEGEAANSGDLPRRVLRVPSPVPTEASSTTETMNQIRKWGCRFDGRDPVSFLERIEELQTCYGLTASQMLTGLPELLKGDALLWHRNHGGVWTCWDDFIAAFRAQYLLHRYRRQLLRELQTRQQQEGEPYLKYATGVLTLMRRAGRLDLDEQVEQLYEGLRPEYKLYARREEVRTLGDLSTRATEFEAIVAQTRETKPAARTRPSNAAALYNRSECCWRCKERGHTRAACRRPAKKFCSQCGKDGVLTRDCHPSAGNADRAGANQADPRSHPESA